jgi:glucuronate isomerase
MTTPFLGDDFLLTTESARRLYHEHAKSMPIFDYHCHLPVQQIAEDKRFDNLYQIWLAGDHYKWRAMRTNGVDERFCTGDATDEQKFMHWAATVPHTVKNPLYVWTHLELKRYFGIDALLGPDSAADIYARCNEMLRTPQFSVRNLLRKMQVKALCTTDDPIDDLRYHRALSADGFEIKILPTFRPDRAMLAEDTTLYNQYLDALGKAADIDICSYQALIAALDKRHEFFHNQGCRLSDHGITTIFAEPFTSTEVGAIFTKVRGGTVLTTVELLKLKSALLIDFARMDASRGWVQQLHLNALRNNNSRLFRQLGPDTGFDSIGDFELAQPLSRFLDMLDCDNQLPKTIIYTLNAADNDVIATMAGAFQDGSVAGKIQFGSGWWFHDQREGMRNQMSSLASLGLLSRFVGMLTDSRSFLSYPRHEYFRRILCQLIGEDVEIGEIPFNMGLLGPMIEDICFNNSKNYIGIDV